MCASAPLQVWPLHVHMFQHPVFSCPAWSPIVLNHDCVVECRKPKLVICCKLEPNYILYWCSHTYLGAQHLANVELHRHDPRPNRWARSRAWSATKCFSDTRSLAADSAGHLRRTTYSPVLPVLCRPVLLTATTSSDSNTQRMDACIHQYACRVRICPVDLFVIYIYVEYIYIYIYIYIYTYIYIHIYIYARGPRFPQSILVLIDPYVKNHCFATAKCGFCTFFFFFL